MDKKTRETGTNRLTDTKVKTAKAETKESTLPDGEGLELRVKPNGGKRWVFKYQRPADKKRTNMGFGTYPEVSLAAARERRREARALLAQSIDPKLHKEEQIATAQAEQEASANTFERMASKWLELKRHDVSEAYAADSWRSLELYVLPFIGDLPIDQIRAPKVIEILRPIEADGKHETVRRLCQRINEILDYSVNHGLLDARLERATSQEVALFICVLSSPLPAWGALTHREHKPKCDLFSPDKPATLAGFSLHGSARWNTLCHEHECITSPPSAANPPKLVIL